MAHTFFLTIFSFFLLYCSSCLCSLDEFSILSSQIYPFYYDDYTPPSPTPPQPPPHPPSSSCQDDLKGNGSLNSLCELNTSLIFNSDVYIEGNGSLHILSNVTLSCPVLGCSIMINISGGFSLHSGAMIIGGTVFVMSQNLSLMSGSLIDVTGLAGEPPEHTSGTPLGNHGAGGGHGGRGADCVNDGTKMPDDVWGGDAYSWSTLDRPWSYGSRGGSTSEEESFGGEGGGRILLNVTGDVDVSGDLLANGGDGGMKGGGGSGGSIYIIARMM